MRCRGDVIGATPHLQVAIDASNSEPALRAIVYFFLAEGAYMLGDIAGVEKCLSNVEALAPKLFWRSEFAPASYQNETARAAPKFGIN